MFWNWFGVGKQHTDQQEERQQSELTWLTQISKQELVTIITETVSASVKDLKGILETGAEAAETITALIDVTLDVADTLQQRQVRGTTRSLFRQPSSVGQRRNMDNSSRNAAMTQAVLERLQDMPNYGSGTSRS